MKILGLILAAAAFAVSAEEGERTPPFITTPGEVVERMLELAGTGPEDLVVDLGSGDGRIVIAAARKFGARGLGIELDEKLVAASRENARLARVADRVAFMQGDVLASDFSQASVVTVYLLPGLIDKLQSRFIYELRPGTRIVSHAFSMAGWRPDRAASVRLTQAHPGQGDESTLYLWVVPAEARGLWQGPATRLRIHQNYQEIELEGTLQGKSLTGAKGLLSGREIEWQAEGQRFRGRVDGERMVGELNDARLELRRSP